MNRKGQFSGFILIGLILVSAVGIGIYVYSKNQVATIIPEISQPATKSQTAETPATFIVASCIQQLSQEGLELIRIQGGYISNPGRRRLMEIEDQKEHVDYSGGLPRLASGPGTSMVAFLLTDSNIPMLLRQEEMERQLGSFIDTLLPGCVNEFSSLEDQGVAVRSLAIPKTTITFADQVIIDTKWPLEGTKGEDTWRSEDYTHHIQVNMPTLIENANVLVVTELLFTYIEKKVKMAISLYSYQGGEKAADDLPPFSFTYVDVSCISTYWTIPEVQDTLGDLLVSEMPLMKLEQGYVWPEMTDDLARGVYQNHEIGVLAEDPNIDTAMTYRKEWGFNEMRIKPSDGSLIAPDTHSVFGIPLLPMMCRDKYRFKYTLKFPVLFYVSSLPSARISAPNVVQGNGFDFRFLMEAYLDGNQEREFHPGVELPSIDEAGLAGAGEIDDVDEQFDSRFCDEARSGQVSIVARDLATLQPLEDAMIYYFCGTESNDCRLGKTDIDGRLDVQLPYCINGVLHGWVAGYGDVREMLSIENTDPHAAELLFSPLKDLNLEIIAIDIPSLIRADYLTDGFSHATCGIDAASMLNSVRTALREDDLVLGQLQLKYGRTPSPVFHYPPIDTAFPRTIKMIPGTYSGSMLFQHMMVLNPSTNPATSETVDLERDDPSRPVSVPLGTTETTFSLDYDQIRDAESIIFYVLKDALPTDVMDFASHRALQEDGSLKMQVTADKDCDGIPESVEWSIPKESYISLLDPTLR